MTEPMLRVQGLNAAYGRAQILFDVALQALPGEVLVLLGRNGAGRTSTLRAILGLTGKRTGSIQVNGRETITMATHHIAHLAKLGDAFEQNDFHCFLLLNSSLRVAFR